MGWYPGAVRKPSPFHGGKRVKGRAFIYHVAVAESRELSPRADASWHFYIAKDGHTTQYIDTNDIAWGNLQGNPSTVIAETQGGVKNADSEPFTSAQVERLADIYAWLHKDEGIPLQIMPDSRPQSRGLGYHRLGIDPWRVSGGELWTSHYGKICPGAAKIKQAPVILSRTRQILGAELMAKLDKDDYLNIAEAVWAFPLGATKGGTVENPVSLPNESAAKRLNAIRRGVIDVRDWVSEDLKNETPAP